MTYDKLEEKTINTVQDKVITNGETRVERLERAMKVTGSDVERAEESLERARCREQQTRRRRRRRLSQVQEEAWGS